MSQAIRLGAVGGLALLSIVRFAAAAYDPIRMHELVLTTETILIGEVTDLQKETYSFRIDEVWKGTVNEKTITVEKFHDWACAQRWGPYVVGERMLLFLTRQEGKWDARGAGNEGESPILDGMVYSHIAWVDPNLLGVDHGRWSRLVGVPMADVRHAVQTFSKCYRVAAGFDEAKGRTRENVPRFVRTADAVQLTKFRSRSLYHEALVLSADPPPRPAPDDTSLAVQQMRERDRLDWPASRIRRFREGDTANPVRQITASLSRNSPAMLDRNRAGRTRTP